MNIAFSTIILFLILAPGFIWRIGYLSSRHSQKLSGRNFIVELTWAVIPAIILQALWIFLVSYWGYEIDYIILGRLVTGSGEIEEIDANFLQIQNHIGDIFWYNSTLFLTSLALGHFNRYIVRRFRFDRVTRLFRFSNKWHYLLSGEFLDFSNVPDDYFDISYAIVDVLCDLGHKNVVYIGELVGFETDKSGGLDMVHIRYPMRRDIDGDSGDYYHIPSNYLIIPYKNIVNLNVRLINDQEIPQESVEADVIDLSKEDQSEYEYFIKDE